MRDTCGHIRERTHIHTRQYTHGTERDMCGTRAATYERTEAAIFGHSVIFCITSSRSTLLKSLFHRKNSSNVADACVCVCMCVRAYGLVITSHRMSVIRNQVHDKESKVKRTFHCRERASSSPLTSFRSRLATCITKPLAFEGSFTTRPVS